MGSDELLLTRAASGDDLTIYIEANGLHEYVIFGNYAVTQDRVNGLGLPHSALPGLFHTGDSNKQIGTVIQHIHDSRTNNVSIQELLDDNKTLTTVFDGHPAHASYTWYSTRRYVEKAGKVGTLQGCGDQFKILLTFSRDFLIVVKPDIVYFPYQGREYLIKSSSMVLPSEFAVAPNKYIQGGKPLTENQSYSVVYLNIGSDDLLTIVHKQRFMARQPLDAHAGDITVAQTAEGRTMVTNIECEHTVLVPES
jgi:hypothetical protein